MKPALFQIRRRPLLASGAALLTACSGAAPTPQPSRTSTAGATSGLLVQPVLPNTDTAVGRNRFSLAILEVGKNGALPKPVVDASLQLRFYYPIAPQPVPKGEATPQFRYVSDKNKGLYVAQVSFDQAGTWGVEINGTAAGQPLATARVQFEVKQKPGTPAIGAAAPPSQNPTRRDVDDIKKIDSGATPNDMHELSIAQAIEQKKPFVVLFASPGFCATQTCAPQLGEVQQLKTKYGAQASFVHVEVWKDPQKLIPWETVTEWGLTTDPWTFMVDRNGNVAEKYEGPAPFAELEPALQKLL